VARSGTDDDLVATVVERVAAAPKYRAVHPDTIRSIVAGEARAGGRPADVEKRARLRLHKAVALFLATASPSELLAQLRSAADEPGFDLRSWCRAAMARHVSTAERLDDIDDLYPTILGLMGSLAPGTALADVACAYNVLALPWLRDNSEVPYVGYDLNADVVALGREVLARAGGPGELVHTDVLVTPDAVGEEVALLLKTYHCLEARAPGSGLQLVEDLPATLVVVSLPTRGGGGRTYGFGGGHGDRIEARAAAQGWTITTARLLSEEIWAIAKRPGPPGA
jgi:16S rRNA (guanine(1405)-N(7))-methyltransferase